MNQLTTAQQFLHGTDKRIAFIQACWHQDIVEQSQLSFIDSLEQSGISKDRIDLYEVPGSLEIPLQAQMLANSKKYAILIGAGLIIDGGIYRHDFVAETVINALMRVQLDTNIPILSVVLTPHHFHESKEHHQFFFDHFKIKGAEAADACIRVLENLAKVDVMRY